MPTTPTQNDHLLYHRLRQLEIVAGFGMFAMRAQSQAELFDEACRVAATGLETPFAKVLEYDPGRHDFLVCAGVGWRPGVVGHERLGAGADSPAGHAFETGRAITANELAGEQRFKVPKLLRDHGIARAINVIIRAGDAPPWGVLEGDSTDRDAFDAHDSDFLQALANTVAAARVMQERLDTLRASEALTRGVFEGSPDCTKVLDPDGIIERINATGAVLMDCSSPDELVGTTWTDMWPEDQRGLAKAALDTARAGGIGHFTGRAPTLRGRERHWDVYVTPIPGQSSGKPRFVSVSRDVSELVQALTLKDQLLEEKDLLMQEVHHRVKNSLQLVRTLLQLQARMQATPEMQAQLEEAAGRISAIGAVHQRLYQGASVAETDAADYLAGVIDDLRSTSAHLGSDRPITLEVDPVVLPAAEITHLGLITVEFVTNALKYGAGEVGVAVRRTGNGIVITVTDQGPGFPPDFDPAASRTLGMRLVSAWARNGNGPTVDRSVPFGRISLTLATMAA